MHRRLTAKLSGSSRQFTTASTSMGAPLLKVAKPVAAAAVIGAGFGLMLVSPVSAETKPNISPFAAAVGGLDPIPSPLPLPPAPETKQSAEKPKKKKKKRSLPNPGKFDKFNREAKNALDAPAITGMRFSLTKMVFPVANGKEGKKKKQLIVQVNTNLAGPPTQANPESVSYSDLTIITQLPPRHKLTGTVDSMGNVIGTHQWKVSKNLDVQSQFRFEPPHPMAGASNSLTTSVDYKGSDYHLEGQVMVGGSSPIYSLSYFQSLLPSFAVGGKITHVFPRTINQWAMRYKSESQNRVTGQRSGDVVTATWLPGQVVGLEYLRKVNNQLHLGVGFNLVPKNRESAVQVGVSYRHRMFQFQASMDSTGRLVSFLDQGISEVARLALSAEVNHGTGENSLGLVMSIGQ